MNAPSLFAGLTVVVKGGGDLGTGVAVRLVRAGFPVDRDRTGASVDRAPGGGVGRGRVRWRDDRGRRDRAAMSAHGGGDRAGRGRCAAAGRAGRRGDRRVAARRAGGCDHGKDQHGHDLRRCAAGDRVGAGFYRRGGLSRRRRDERGHFLGRVRWQGSTEADTGQPGYVPGVPSGTTRVLRAPVAGQVSPHFAIGARIPAGATIATVAGPDGDAPVIAFFDGVLRGLIHPRVTVPAGLKIGDLDPRAALSIVSRYPTRRSPLVEVFWRPFWTPAAGAGLSRHRSADALASRDG